jgi:hypothetical protein
MLVAAVFALATVLVGASRAQAAFPNEAGYACTTGTDSSNGRLLRDEFLFDPGVCAHISGDQFAAEPLFSYYEGMGFDANFLDWAPIVSRTDIATRKWGGCIANHGPGTVCPGGLAGVGFADAVDNDFLGPATVKSWNGGAFIGVVCGNFSLTGDKTGPIPTISGTKFDDRNGDGVQDGSESGLPGVTIHLFKNGGLVASVATGAGGAYTFELDADTNPALGPGTYTLTEDVPSGYHQTAAPGAITVGSAIGDQAFTGNNFGNAKAQPTISTVASGATHVGANIFDTATLSGGASPSGVVNFALYGPGDTTCTATPIATVTGTLSGGTATSPDVVSDTPGLYRWVASYPGDGANYDVASTCGSETVLLYAPISATPTAINGVEGAPFTAAMANFTDPDPASTPAEYTATIDWGDGTPTTAATISQPGGPGAQYVVTGTHFYDEEDGPSGPYKPTITITDIGDAFNTATVISQATIVDAPLTGSSVVVTATEGLPFTSTNVGTFVDADPDGMVTDYTATIDWGDGTPITAGTVTGPNGGPFTVLGGHDYLHSGTYTITIPVLDAGGAMTTIVDTVTVAHAFCTGTLTATDAQHVITGSVPGSLHLSGGTWIVRNAKVGGSINVTPGTSLLVTNSSVGGAVDGAPGGELIVSHSTVNGAVIAQQGQPAAVCFSTVSGALSADRGPDGLQVCSSTINGSITVSGSTDLVKIGDASKQCAPNTLTSQGAILFSNDNAGLDLSGNTMYGSLHVSSSDGTSPPLIAGNTIGGSLACDHNTPPPVDGGQPNRAAGARLGQCSATTF